MTAFQKAEALAMQRYERDKLLALVDEVTTHFRMPNSFERSKMRAVCRYLADALDRCSGSTLQQRWNDFEKRFWPKWKAGVDRRGREYWTWGARVLISARMIAPSLDMLSDLRVNQWIAHLPEDHPLAQQHTSLLQATNSIKWTSAHSRQLAVSNGLRILLIRGYDSLHHIKDDDLKLLAVRWSKGTDALDAALCSLGVFSRTPKRGSARHGRRQRMTAPELVENAGVPDRFKQVMILYLEAYEARVSDVYRTLRHKVIALAHFWRFIRDRHPDVKRCSQILPRHVRNYIPHAIRRAREVQRGPGADEVRPTAHSWLVELRVFFSDLCAWSGFVAGKPNYVIIYGEGCFNSKRQARRTVELYNKYRSQVHFVVVDLDVQRSPEQQQLVKQYYKGYIPHVLVLDADGTPRYNQSGEVESRAIEDIFQKSLRRE